MNRIRFGGAATTIIGGIWALIALIYSNDQTIAFHEFATGMAVAFTGVAVWLLAAWREGR